MKDKADKKICELMNELANFQELQKDHSDNLEKLYKLYELGIVNEEGEYIAKERTPKSLSKLYELGIVNEEGEYIAKERDNEKQENIRF